MSSLRLRAGFSSEVGGSGAVPTSHNAAASTVVPPVPESRSLFNNLESRTSGPRRGPLPRSRHSGSVWPGLVVGGRITDTGVTPEEKDRVSVVGTAPDPPRGKKMSGSGQMSDLTPAFDSRVASEASDEATMPVRL